MWTIILIYLINFIIISLIIKKSHLWEIFALSNLIFIGILGMVPFIFAEYLNVSYINSTIYVLAILIIFLTIIKLFKVGDKLSTKLKEYIPKEFKLISFGTLSILISILLVVKGLTLPVRGWDAYTMYDGRARYLVGGLKFSDFKEFNKYEDTNYLYYFGYPPMTSVVHAVLYSSGFKSPMFIYALFYISLCIFSYLMIEKAKINKLLKYGLFLILALNPLIVDHLNVAYTNLPIASLFIAALYFLLKFFENRNYQSLIFSGVMLGFSNWIRVLEPVFITLIVTFILIEYFGSKTKGFKIFISFIVYTLFAISPRLLWSFYVTTNVGSIGATRPNLSMIFIALSQSLYLSNIIEVLYFMFISLWPLRYYAILFAVIICYQILKKRVRLSLKTYVVLSVIIVNISIMFFGTLYFSQTFIWWNEITGSFLRSNFILIPFIAIYSSYALEDINRIWVLKK